MEILNVGPFELLLILVIALIVLGPERMVNTAKQGGKLLHKFIQSPYWSSIVRTTQEIRNIPRKIVQEAGLEESMQEFSRMRAQSLAEDLEKGGYSPNHAVGENTIAPADSVNVQPKPDDDTPDVRPNPDVLDESSSTAKAE